MEPADIRWRQRFSNFKKAVTRLGEAVNERTLDSYSELEKEGLIQRFEYTYELAWKTLQDLFQGKDFEDIVGPRPVLELAFQLGFIVDAEAWIALRKARNLTSHLYDETTATDISAQIFDQFYALFKALETRLEAET